MKDVVLIYPIFSIFTLATKRYTSNRVAKTHPDAPETQVSLRIVTWIEGTRQVDLLCGAVKHDYLLLRGTTLNTEYHYTKQRREAMSPEMEREW
jgi:hypothetical protein